MEKRYLIINRETNLRDGAYHSIKSAENSLKYWKSEYPTLNWYIKTIPEQDVSRETLKGRHPHDNDQTRKQLQLAIEVFSVANEINKELGLD